jgi:hypothetical protein
MDTGATLAVTVQAADKGDTQTVGPTLSEAIENLSDVNEDRIESGEETLRTEEAVMDKAITATRCSVIGRQRRLRQCDARVAP